MESRRTLPSKSKRSQRKNSEIGEIKSDKLLSELNTSPYTPNKDFDSSGSKQSFMSNTPKQRKGNESVNSWDESRILNTLDRDNTAEYDDEDEDSNSLDQSEAETVDSFETDGDFKYQDIIEDAEKVIWEIEKKPSVFIMLASDKKQDITFYLNDPIFTLKQACKISKK